MLKSTYNRGFILEFSNGFSISVQYGSVTSEAQGLAVKHNDLKNPITESLLAIVSIFDDRQRALVIDESTMISRQSANQVADWIHKVATAKNHVDIIGYVEEAWM